LFKRALILALGIVAAFLLLEMLLNVHNPFTSIPSNLEELEKPRAIIRNYTSKASSDRHIAIIDFSEPDSSLLPYWSAGLTGLTNQKLKIQFEIFTKNTYAFDLSNLELIGNFNKNPKYQTTILILTPSILYPFLPIPSELKNTSTFVLESKDNEPEIFTLFKALNNNNKKDTAIFDFDAYKNNKSREAYIDPTVALNEDFVRHRDYIIQSIIEIENQCKKRGQHLMIVGAPILWHNEKEDRLSGIPLNKVDVYGNLSGWYWEYYLDLMKSIDQKSNPNTTFVLPIYEIFPKNSMYFKDGFSLNKNGNQLFGEMIKGSLEFKNYYRRIF
jgi:hypothetical protein